MKLNQIVNTILFEDKIIKQGGNAFNNVQRINLQNIDQTINDFVHTIIIPALNLQKFNYNCIFKLGSTGKKSSSGDIDLGLNTLLFKQIDITSLIDKIFNYTKNNTNINIIINPVNNKMIQFAFPVSGKKAFVQIDLLFVEYPTFTQWYMFSPLQSESKYKGAHRNELLRAIAKTLSYKSLEKQNNVDVKWKQQDINYNGNYFQIQSIVDNNGKRLLYKNKELLLPEYAQILSQKQISHSPNKVIQRYVGDFNPYYLTSFEKLFSVINSNNFKYKNLLQQILFNAKIIFKQNNKLIFPNELI